MMTNFCLTINQISTIKGILPDVTERQIKIALTKAANNIEQALEYLLTGTIHP